MTMILLLLIHMKGIPLVMIQIEVILQTAPHLLQKPLIARQFTFASFGYYSEQYPYLQSWPTKLLFTAQYKNTMQKYYSRKARGQYTVHKQ